MQEVEFIFDSTFCSATPSDSCAIEKNHAQNAHNPIAKILMRKPHHDVAALTWAMQMLPSGLVT